VASVAKEILRRVAPSRTHSERSIANAAECLRATRSLGALVRELREATAPYDPAKPEHETLLEDLWSALRPGARGAAREARCGSLALKRLLCRCPAPRANQRRMGRDWLPGPGPGH
jgi:hypothetical protein